MKAQASTSACQCRRFTLANPLELLGQDGAVGHSAIRPLKIGEQSARVNAPVFAAVLMSTAPHDVTVPQEMFRKSVREVFEARCRSPPSPTWKPRAEPTRGLAGSCLMTVRPLMTRLEGAGHEQHRWSRFSLLLWRVPAAAVRAFRALARVGGSDATEARDDPPRRDVKCCRKGGGQQPWWCSCRSRASSCSPVPERPSRPAGTHLLNIRPAKSSSAVQSHTGSEAPPQLGKRSRRRVIANSSRKPSGLGGHRQAALMR